MAYIKFKNTCYIPYFLHEDDPKDDALHAPALLPSLYFHLVVKPQNDSCSQTL